MNNNEKALQLEREREIMKEIFREKREKIRKDNRIAINTEKFVKESDDLNKKLAKDTVGLVHLNQFQKIREDIETDKNREKEEEEKKRKLLKKQAASRLSFEANFEEEEEDLFDRKRSKRLGADPTVKSYFEASDYAAATNAALDSSKARQEQEKLTRYEKRKAIPVRLTLSFYDGADHRFCVDFKRGDGLREVLKKCQNEYGPLRGVLLENLMFVKENLILPLEMSVFDLEELGALKDGGRGPYANSDLFSFLLQKSTHNSVVEASTSEEMIETDASRNAKICTIAWFERNKHLVPAKYWIPFDPSKHCRKNKRE